MPSSTELIEMAHTEWKNREERRELHDEVSWESGWISGYLSRPHTPAPFPTKEQLKELSDSECFWEKGEAIQKHDDAIARAATLKTLDKEITALSNQIGALRNLEPEFGSENEIEIRVLSRWKLRLQESLRQQAGERE